MTSLIHMKSLKYAWPWTENGVVAHRDWKNVQIFKRENVSIMLDE